MKNDPAKCEVVTITLNPAIDRTVTIPNFIAGAVNRVEQERMSAGGKGVNVASVLADYGHRVVATGFLGRENCALFEALFARKKIEDHFIRIAGKTRFGIKITDPVQNQTTEINFPGLVPASGDLELLHEKLAKIDGDWFVIAGSLPPGVDSAIYRDIIRSLKARGSKVMVDSSGEALRCAIEAAPHIIKPNIHELEALLGRRLSTETAVIKSAKELLAEGIELVVVSMGKMGAVFVTQAGAFIARSPEITAVITVGAGDAMVAGIVAAQLRNKPLADCARLATAFSMVALSRLEAGLGAPSAIESAQEQVVLEQSAASS